MRITIVIGPFYPIPPVLGGAVEKVHLLLAGAVRVAYALPPADVTITNAFFLPLVLPHRRAGKIYVQVGRYPKGQMSLYFRADRLQAGARAVGQAIARQVPWLKRKIVIIPYAISDLYFAEPADSRRQSVVLYVGRIAREKGIELLIRGFARLRPEGDAAATKGWRLRIIGPHAVAQGGDGAEYLEQLQALAQQRGIGCEFLGPIFDQDALIGEYRGAGVFVYPSLPETGESLGLAPLEAMATGCAAIVSDLRCFDDFIEDGVTGLRFDHRGADPADALAVQLARLIGTPEFLHQVAAAGRGMAGNFRTSVIARRMLDDFKSLLARPDGESVAR